MTTPEDLARELEALLPSVHIFISDGQYRYAAEKLASALQAQPAPQGDVVEAVARIINPGSWSVMDAEKARMLRKYKGQSIGWPADQFQHKESMAKAREILAALASLPSAEASFQNRVGEWMGQCFTPEIIADKLERSDRFIEEALELVQACGYDAARAHALVDYVFGRPVGEPSQEVGGVMVTLAALCNPHGLDMQQAAEAELSRILRPEIIEKIRVKQASKPTGSALPVPSAEAGAEPVAYRYVHYDYAGRKFSRYGTHAERVNGHDPIEVHPLYAAPPTEAAPVMLCAKEIAASALKTACETDPADPEHPDTVMLTTGDFETIVRLAIENSCEGNPTEAAIRADEREKCLKIVQAHCCTGVDGDFYKGINSACHAIAKTIRSRGEG